MKKKSIAELGDLQREIMEILWDMGGGPVHEVREMLKKKRDLAYTTILSSMQKLEKKGWLKHNRKGKNYIYIPVLTREEESARSLRSFIDDVFQGDPLNMFQHFIDYPDWSDEDLKEIRRMVKKRRKEKID